MAHERTRPPSSFGDAASEAVARVEAGAGGGGSGNDGEHAVSMTSDARIASRWLPARRLRAAAAAVLAVSLAACADWPARDETPGTGELLRSGLPVAAAALAGGQLDVARRLYASLSERFDGAPEPLLGLGYIAFRSGDAAAAERYFLRAAERAGDAPAMRAEALLGAGHAALVQGATQTARRHFRNARTPGEDAPPEAWEDTPSAAWIANGLAIVAVLESDYEAAEAHYDDALRLSSGSARIAANYIRMLVAAGRIDDAAHAYAQHPRSHWPDHDGVDLWRLIEEARLQRRIAALAGPHDEADAVAADGSRVSGDVTPGRTGRDAPLALDPDLAMNLYLSDALSARPGDDAGSSRGPALPRHSALVLHLDDWPDPSTPPVEDAAGAPDAATGARSPASPASPAQPFGVADAGAATPPAPSEAADAGATTSPAPSRRPPGPIVAGAGSPAPGSAVVPPRAGVGAAAPEPAAAGRSAPPPLYPLASWLAAQGHPRHEEAGAGGGGSPDHSPPTTLTLTVGQSRRLHLERDATTVLVASPEVADVQLLSPGVLNVIGKGVGRTTVAALADDRQIEERVVAVVLDLEPLRTILASEPDLRGVQARRLSRGMALTGEVASAAAVDRALRLAAGALPEGVTIVNELRIAGPQQVNLEVQIAEVHRSVTEDLGVNWEAFRVRGNGGFGVRIGRFIDDSGVRDDLLLPPSGGFRGQDASSIYFGRRSANSRIAAMIDALATAGLANVLARPNLTAVSGESASFFSGGERPIPSGYDASTRTIIFEYKKVGVLLDFVPTVVDTGRIVLTVRPEVSEPDASQPLVIGPVLLPVINVRRAETTVEVGDGESIVIAGLFSNRSSSTEAGLPGLKDVPLLGVLFGTTSTQSNELELIVIVTARLVEPHVPPDDGSARTAMLQASGYRQ